jgi:hypothetical protein
MNMRNAILFFWALLLTSNACFSDLDTGGNFTQQFNDSKCFDDEVADKYTIKWCSENQNFDSKNGNPKGSLRVELGEPGARLWYLFEGAKPKPASLHIEFDYSNWGGSKDFIPTTGRVESQTSTDNKLNCPNTGWNKQADLGTTWDTGGQVTYSSASFDVPIGKDDLSVYIQFIKPQPNMGNGIVMSIDNIKITPAFSNFRPPATQPAKK